MKKIKKKRSHPEKKKLKNIGALSGMLSKQIDKTAKNILSKIFSPSLNREQYIINLFALQNLGEAATMRLKTLMTEMIEEK